jgi:hypothetical protein
MKSCNICHIIEGTPALPRGLFPADPAFYNDPERGIVCGECNRDIQARKLMLERLRREDHEKCDKRVSATVSKGATKNLSKQAIKYMRRITEEQDVLIIPMKGL